MILSRIIPEGFKLIPLRQIIVTNSPKFILLKFVFSSATSKENPRFFSLPDFKFDVSVRAQLEN